MRRIATKSKTDHKNAMSLILMTYIKPLFKIHYAFSSKNNSLEHTLTHTHTQHSHNDDGLAWLLAKHYFATDFESSASVIFMVKANERLKKNGK